MPAKTEHDRLVLAVAKAIVKAEGDYIWKDLKDVKKNPSTAWLYEQRIEMAEAVIKELRKTSFKRG